MAQDKRLYKGVFLFRHKMVIKYLNAHSEKQAKVFMLRRIASEHKVPYGVVFDEFTEGNYTITEETK